MSFALNRNVTNKIRFLMDECLPAAIRDNKYFMFPFYYICFKGKNVSKIMNWKTYVNTLSEKDYTEFYRNIELRALNRKTDLNPDSLNFILSHIGEDKEQSILDVGCGKGFLLEQIKNKGYKNVSGCDLFESQDLPDIKYFKSNIENLPFKDKEFDIVNCSHVLEHTVHLDKAILELIRVTRHKLIITVPCQKYFRYTLDLHLHFFPEKTLLEQQISIKDHICEKKDGDLVYIGFLKAGPAWPVGQSAGS